jgi:hypothetical protein
VLQEEEEEKGKGKGRLFHNYSRVTGYGLHFGLRLGYGWVTVGLRLGYGWVRVGLIRFLLKLVSSTLPLSGAWLFH